jgi:hypothetical protein
MLSRVPCRVRIPCCPMLPHILPCRRGWLRGLGTPSVRPCKIAFAAATVRVRWPSMLHTYVPAAPRAARSAQLLSLPAGDGPPTIASVQPLRRALDPPIVECAAAHDRRDEQRSVVRWPSRVQLGAHDRHHHSRCRLHTHDRRTARVASPRPAPQPAGVGMRVRARQPARLAACVCAREPCCTLTRTHQRPHVRLGLRGLGFAPARLESCGWGGQEVCVRVGVYL